MSMEDYFCEFLAIEIHVPKELFDAAAFLEDVKDVSDTSRKSHAWVYDSVEKPNNQHAHLAVDLRSESVVRISMQFHCFAREQHDAARPPYMEDCGQWVGKFLRAEEFPAELNAAYRFGKGYAPIVAIPFPLLTTRKELKGSQIVGFSVQPPRKMNIKEAIIQKDKDSFTVFIERSLRMNLKTFDLEKELEALSNPIMQFVRKGEAE